MDPDLYLWGLCMILVLIFGIFIWYRSWSLDFLTDPDLYLWDLSDPHLGHWGFQLILILRLGSLCDPRLGLYVVRVIPVWIFGISVILVLIFWCSNYWASPGGDVGFVSLQPPEGRCRVFDKYSSDTCKAARDVCDFLRPHRCASTWSGDLECVSGVSHSPKLPVNPSIFQENAGSPGWRPAGGYARTAGLRLGFSTAAKEGRADANWGGSARRVRLFGKPKICCLLPPKEDAAPRRSDSRETEREKPRARRDTTERCCCPFPAPPPHRGGYRLFLCRSCFISFYESSTAAPPTGHSPSSHQQEAMQRSSISFLVTKIC